MIEILTEELERLNRIKNGSQEIGLQILRLKKVISILNGEECNEKINNWSKEGKGFACSVFICLKEEKDRLQYLLDNKLFNINKEKVLRFERALKYWGNPLERN